jgi:hypothetical protein
MIMTSLVRPITSFAALVAASVSVASHASDNPALERCVQMFVTEVVPADHSVEIRREDILASTTAINATRSRVTLIARGEQHGAVFGRAACVIDRSGLLVAMYLYDPQQSGPIPSRPKVLARNLDAKQGSRTAYAGEMKPF